MLKLNRLYATLSALVAMLALPAFAAVENEEVTIVKKKVVYEDSSEYNRMDQRYLLTGQLIGFSVAPVVSTGINLGYYVNRNMIAQLEYSDGSAPVLFFKLEAQTIGANLKYFVGNSFYVKGGAAYRKISIKDLECFLCSSSSYTKDAGSVESYTAELAIGNQWQWDNFTLGCDWIGVMAPFIQGKVDDPTSSDKRISASTRSEVERSWSEIGRATSVEFLRFYLGASF